MFTTPRRARRRRVGHQRREVLLVERRDGVVPHRDGGHRSRRERVPGHVDVPRARPTRPASRSCATSGSAASRVGRGHARAHPLRRRARARRRTCSAARARPSRSPRPGSAAGASTTPCARSACASRRFDMMCERALQPRRRRARCSPTSSSCRSYIADSYAQLKQFRLLVLHTAWLIDQLPGLPQGPQGHRRGEGAHAEGHHTTSCTGRSRCTARSACRTRCRSPACAWPARSWASPTARPRCTRSPSPARCCASYKPADDLWPDRAPAEEAGGGPSAKFAELPRARGGEPVSTRQAPDGPRRAGTDARRRRARRVDGRARPARRGRADRAALRRRAAARTRSSRSAAATSTARSASRRTTAPAARDEAILREWRIIDALDGTDVPAHARRSRSATTRRCSAAPST